MRRGALVLLIALYGSAAYAEPIKIQASKLDTFSRADPSRTEFGKLVFRGGLVLTSEDARFGGFSGIRLDADGAGFRAVSDRANWLTGRILYDGTKPVGVEAAEMFPVRGPKGGPVAGTRYADVEALEIAGTTAWLGIERRHAILKADLSKGEAAPGVSVSVPKGFASLPSNAGIEALGIVPDGAEKGTLLAVAEEGFDAAGNHRAWLLAGTSSRPARALSVKRRDDYAVTDLAFLPGGDLILLERRYRPILSLHMRVRRIALADIREGAVLDGEVLIEAGLTEEIDNMEGVAAHRADDGTDVLTLISDDNFSGWQRTVLLQFGLAE